MNEERLTAKKDAPRTDSFLSEALGRSRSYFAELIEKGCVLVNGNIPKKSAAVKCGDQVWITFPPEQEPDITPKEIPFNVIHDTERYVVIDKPAGITVHPAPGHYDDSLVNGLLYAFKINDEESGIRPGIVHRLDKDTSGLMIVAKDRDARQMLSQMFHDRKIDKYYLAVAQGSPRFLTMTVEAPIGRDRAHRKRMAVCEGGRTAKSVVTVKNQYKKAFLAEVRLFTGRTHQIRVHMKHIGHPLLGDELYGGKSGVAHFHRQALHASRLEFSDPFTREPLILTADLPEDMQALITGLKE